MINYNRYFLNVLTILKLVKHALEKLEKKTPKEAERKETKYMIIIGCGRFCTYSLRKTRSSIKFSVKLHYKDQVITRPVSL